MKVFLSSTFSDLIEYRKAAVEALERLGQQVDRMEIFGARPKEPVKACLQEIEDCDIFIGIYAHRYGFIPQKSNISITEQEFLHAKSIGKLIFCFLVDEENQAWLPKFMEDEPGKSKLKAFKQAVKGGFVVDFFTTPADLGMRIGTAIGSYLARNNLIPIPYPPAKSSEFALPYQPYFFGREKELNIIADAITPESRTWGALVDGPGGIGKTALAIRAAYLAPEKLFDHKIFITAKVRELTPEGERPLKDFSRDNYFSMLDELARELGEDDIPRLVPDERANRLRLALAGKKILIIFDNLETLPEDERTRLFVFLSRLPQGNKAVVTSRRRADVDARIIRLDRLKDSEALDLIAKLAETNPRLAREDEKARRDLYEITNGNPLLIKWICGQLGRVGTTYITIADAYEFIKNTPTGNDPLEYIFGDLVGTFTPHEMAVVAALSHFSEFAHVTWIASITELAEEAVETALEDLNERSIINASNEERWFMLPALAAQFIQRKQIETVEKTGNCLANGVYWLVRQYGLSSTQGHQIIENELPLVVAALPRILNSKNSHFQIFVSCINKFLQDSGRWDDYLWLNNLAEKKAIEANNLHHAGWRAFESGIIYSARMQTSEVLECVKRAENYWKNDGAREKSIAIKLQGLSHSLENNYLAAITAYSDALKIRLAINPESDDVAIILGDLANAKIQIGEYLSAEQDCNDALKIYKKLKEQEGIAITTTILANLAIKQEQWGKAELLTRKSYGISRKISNLALFANSCSLRAQVILNQGNPRKALRYARNAVNIFAHLRVPDDLKEAQDTLAEVEKKIEENRK